MYIITLAINESDIVPITDIIKKIGVTRRVFTAGLNKDRLDPFEPVDPADKVKIQSILKEVHEDFINDVLVGRKGKLNGDPAEHR